MVLVCEEYQSTPNICSSEYFMVYVESIITYYYGQKCTDKICDKRLLIIPTLWPNSWNICRQSLQLASLEVFCCICVTRGWRGLVAKNQEKAKETRIITNGPPLAD